MRLTEEQAEKIQGKLELLKALLTIEYHDKNLLPQRFIIDPGKLNFEMRALTEEALVVLTLVDLVETVSGRKATAAAGSGTKSEAIAKYGMKSEKEAEAKYGRMEPENLKLQCLGVYDVRERSYRYIGPVSVACPLCQNGIWWNVDHEESSLKDFFDFDPHEILWLRVWCHNPACEKALGVPVKVIGASKEIEACVHTTTTITFEYDPSKVQEWDDIPQKKKPKKKLKEEIVTVKPAEDFGLPRSGEILGAILEELSLPKDSFTGRPMDITDTMPNNVASCKCGAGMKEYVRHNVLTIDKLDIGNVYWLHLICPACMKQYALPFENLSAGPNYLTVGMLNYASTEGDQRDRMKFL